MKLLTLDAYGRSLGNMFILNCRIASGSGSRIHNQILRVISRFFLIIGGFGTGSLKRLGIRTTIEWGYFIFDNLKGFGRPQQIDVGLVWFLTAFIFQAAQTNQVSAVQTVQNILKQIRQIIYKKTHHYMLPPSTNARSCSVLGGRNKFEQYGSCLRCSFLCAGL